MDKQVTCLALCSPALKAGAGLRMQRQFCIQRQLPQQGQNFDLMKNEYSLFKFSSSILRECGMVLMGHWKPEAKAFFPSNSELNDFSLFLASSH